MINTLVINGLTLGTYASGYLFGKHEGFDFPKVRVDVKDKGLYHGARLGSYNYGRRIFAIEGQIIGNTASDFENKRRAFEQAFDLDNGLQTITVNTRSGLSLQASVIIASDMQLPYTKGQVTYCDFQIQLVAPYPYILSANKLSTSLNIFNGGGAAFPATFPMSFANGGTGATVIANNGNAKAYPTITITGPVTNPSIQNATTGKQISLIYTLNTSTDKIVLDFYNRTAMYNNITNILQYVSGDWWTLSPGNNTVKLTATTANNTGLAVVDSYDTYLGI